MLWESPSSILLLSPSSAPNDRTQTGQGLFVCQPQNTERTEAFSHNVIPRFPSRLSVKELPSAFHYALLLDHALRRPQFIRTVELSLPSQLASLLNFQGGRRLTSEPPPLLTGGLAITNGLSVLLSYEPVCRLVMPVEYAVSGTIGTTRSSSDWSLSNQILHTPQARPIRRKSGPLVIASVLTGARVVPRCEPVHGGGAPLLLHPLRRLLVRLPVHPADRRSALQLHGLWWVHMTLTVK